MSQSRTRVQAATIRSRAPLAHVKQSRRHADPPPARAGKPPQTEGSAKALGFGERMLRNTAISVALLLCVLAAQSLNTPGATGATNLLAQVVSMDLSESLGSLRFVSNLVPESAAVFWNLGGEKHAPPSTAQVVHAFSAREPWVGYDTGEAVASAPGEVMSVSVDPAGRYVIRLRHASGMESLYGNLLVTEVHEGDWVETGAVLGAAKLLTYELRGEGRAMDPAPFQH